MELHINQHLSQTQRLSPQMQLSLSMLQMDNFELADYLQELTTENPVIELEYQKTDKDAALTDKLLWLQSQSAYPKNTASYNPDDDTYNSENALESKEETLEEILTMQLVEMNLAPDLYHAGLYIIRSLDSNGYLTTPIADIKARTGWSGQLVQKAWGLVKQLDPPGVGARSLKECILLQLQRKGELTKEAETIVCDYLVELSRGRFSYIAQQTGQTTPAIKEIYHIIKDLNPKPCACIGRSQTRYITPDLIIVKFKDHFDVILNDFNLPKILIRQDYLNLLSQSPDKQTEKYINNKLKQANWVTDTINRRKETILETGKILLSLQQAFFEKGKNYLVPIGLQDIADRLQVHPSTVSRIIAGKYLQCSYGVFPLKYFLTQGVPTKEKEETISSKSVKNIMLELIKNEPKNHPYSDQALCGLLKKQGIILSRRTVAKYRTQEQIPAAALRKESSATPAL